MQHLLHWPFFHFSLVSFSFFQHNTFTCKTTHRPSPPPSLSAAILAASTRYKFTKYFLNIHINTQIFESKYYKNYTLLFLNYGISLYYFRSCMISPKQTYDLRIKNLWLLMQKWPSYEAKLSRLQFKSKCIELA